MRKLFHSFAAASLLAAFSASATAQEACTMDIKFENPAEMQAWRVVNDGVMGGLSEGDMRLSGSHMVFEGVINTDGGGFSSIRVNVTPGALSDAKSLRLRVKSDGRDYKFTFRTNARRFGRSISFQKPVPATVAGEWADVDIALEDMRASIFGRTVQRASFDKSEVWQMGIILADGKDGPFQFRVDRIQRCK